MKHPVEHTHTYRLTAGESGAEATLPVTLLLERIIEVATEHANLLEIGYEQLNCRGIAWVLSRVSFEMKRYPVINEVYSLTTWIEGYNRHFSDRCFTIHDGEDHIIGYVYTMWTAIDIKRRCVADLDLLEKDLFPVSPKHIPLTKAPRLKTLVNPETEDYTFKYCDIDFNRHVNSVRYLALLLNRWPLDYYDSHEVGRLDICFHRECHFGETVSVAVSNDADVSECEITADGTRAVGFRIIWRDRIFE